MGPHAYMERGLNLYLKMAFRDSSDDWFSEIPEWMSPDNPERWSLRHLHSIEHYLPSDTPQKNENINYDWDWKEDDVFGGKEGFFSPGAVILDLGGGMGKPAAEINEAYADKSIKCLSVDYRYHREGPTLQKDKSQTELVAGHFRDLPFGDDTFDRVLAIETFPAWLPRYKEDTERYFMEITRVCRNGAIWRGTFASQIELESKNADEDDVIAGFTKNGWELVIDRVKNSFMARLAKQ